MGTHEIFGTKGNRLKDKKIFIGVTGSIAAIETPHLVREIIRYSGEPVVALTKEATRFVTTDALMWSMGTRPIDSITGFSEHIEWTVNPTKKVDLCLICPATANTIAKIAAGIADTPVTLIALASLGAKIPVIIVPNAHSVLLDNVIIQNKISYLKKLGIRFIQSSEEENKYKYPPLSMIMQAIFDTIDSVSVSNLKDLRFIVTGGATREYIDDVRFISNPSTGKSALLIAKELQDRGAEVELVLGEGHTVEYSGLSTTIVRSTRDMLDCIIKKLSTNNYSGLVSVAAVSDYTPEKTQGKIPSGKELAIKFKPTPKIIKEIRKKFPKLLLVGYKAEVGITPDELVKRGKESLADNNLDLVVANWVGEKGKGFASETNEVYLLKKDGSIIHKQGTKKELAKTIVDIIESLVLEVE